MGQHEAVSVTKSIIVTAPKLIMFEQQHRQCFIPLKSNLPVIKMSNLLNECVHFLMFKVAFNVVECP